MIMMTMTVSRKPVMKPIYKSILGCPCLCRVNGNDRANWIDTLGLQMYTQGTQRKVMLLEMKNPWVENREAIKEHKTWRLELKKQVSGLKDHPVLNHVTCRAW